MLHGSATLPHLTSPYPSTPLRAGKGEEKDGVNELVNIYNCAMVPHGPSRGEQRSLWGGVGFRPRNIPSPVYII